MALDDPVFLDLAECHEALEDALVRAQHALDPILAHVAPGEWPDFEAYVAMLSRVSQAFEQEMPFWLARAADADQQELDRLEAMNPN